MDRSGSAYVENRRDHDIHGVRQLEDTSVYVECDDAALVRLEDEQCIWRYVTVPAFLDTLQTSTLFFPKLKTLIAVDPWEGHLTAVIERMISDAVFGEEGVVPRNRSVDDSAHELLRDLICVS
jgi:hypothetical protein